MILVLAATAQLAGPLLTFSRAPSFDRRPVSIEVGVLRSGPKSEFWLRRSVGQRNAETVSWTDTVRCPVARAILHEAAKLEMPRVSVPGLENDQIVITADGIAYRLAGTAAYPNKTGYDFDIMSNTDTPLARWIDRSLLTLESCWSKVPPKTD